jgi:hypothetical protein
MVYRVHTRLAQLALHKGDELPKLLIKPDPISKCPHHRSFRKMMKRSYGNTKNKPKT